MRRHFEHAPALVRFTLSRHCSQSVHNVELRKNENGLDTSQVRYFLRSSRRAVHTTIVLHDPREAVYSAGVVVAL